MEWLAALILSEFMGCYRSLSGALRVNPWNIEQVVSSIHQALQYSRSRRQGECLMVKYGRFVRLNRRNL